MKRLFPFFCLLLALLGCGRSTQSAPDGGTPHKVGLFGVNPSPLCLVKDGSGSYVAASPNGVTVGQGDTITVKLASTAGVRFWSLSVYGLDEYSTAPALTYAAGPPATYSFTFPNAAGRTVLLKSVVNGGTDVNGVVQPSLTTTLGTFSASSNGGRVIASGETFESCAAGWICDFNAAMRAANSNIVGGIYSTGSPTVALTTAGTRYLVPLTVTYALAQNTAAVDGGVMSAISGPVLVEANLSLHTGSTSTTVGLILFKNGAALTDPVSEVVTGSSSQFMNVTALSIVSATASDVFTVYAVATTNTITLSYFGKLVVTSVGAAQGIQGPQGVPGTGGGGGSIGGGPAGAPQSGAVTLPATTAVVALDLRSQDANIDLSTVIASDGLAYQFDCLEGLYAANFTGATMTTPTSGGATVTSYSVAGGGQSVTVKYNGTLAVWQFL